jgi:hypothetical protein
MPAIVETIAPFWFPSRSDAPRDVSAHAGAERRRRVMPAIVETIAPFPADVSFLA